MPEATTKGFQNCSEQLQASGVTGDTNDWGEQCSVEDIIAGVCVSVCVCVLCMCVCVCARETARIFKSPSYLSFYYISH